MLGKLPGITIAVVGDLFLERYLIIESALAERSGRVLSVPYLLETVWGYDPADYNDPGTVEVHISHLRKKLGDGGPRVVTVWGIGYRLEPDGGA